MATINHSSGADIIVPNNNGTTYRGLGGDDTYILSNSIAANAAITIVDTSGANKIQLVDGLSVASTKFAADAVQLTLTNGAVVTINGASNFDFDLGGNSTAGTSGSVSDFAGFAAGAGVATLPTSGSVAGASNVSVAGTAWSSGGSASYSVTTSGTKVTEGNDVTFTITSSTAVSADTTFSWTVIGDTNGATVTAATNDDIDVLSGTATIAAGSTSTTFAVTPTTDAVVEGIEGIKVSVFDSASNAISSSKILVDNGGSSATNASFTLTTGVDTFTGRSGDDSFDATTEASLNDYDVIDGGAGVDTLTLQVAAADGGTTLIPQLSGIEIIQATNSAATDGDSDGSEILTVATAGLTGITAVANIAGGAGAAGVTFNDLAGATDVTIKSGVGTTTVNHNATAFAGANDAITVTVSGTSSTTVAITDDSLSTATVLEEVTVNSISVANTLADLQLSSANVPSLKITGSTSLTISAALDSSVTSIDASGMPTGGFTLSAAPAAAAVTVVGSGAADTIAALGAGNHNLSMGGGNDTVDFEGTWTAKDTLDGGAGTDTISVLGSVNNSGLNATIFDNLTNVEVLDAEAANDNSVISLDSNTPFTTIDLDDANHQELNLNDGYTQATTVSIDADQGDTINNNANVDLTLNAYSGAVQADLNLTGSTGKNDVINLTLITDNLTSTFDTGNDVFETININPFTAGADFELVTGAYALGATGGDLTINAAGLDAASVLTIAGNSSATPMNITTGIGGDIILLGTKADTVNSGAGNDSITTLGGVNTVNAGDGVDTVVMGNAIDIIDAGAGNDIITSANRLANTDVVDGGAGTDTLTHSTTIDNPSVMGGVSNIEVINPLGNGVNVVADGDMGGARTFLFSDTNTQAITLGGAGKTWTDATTVQFTAGVSGNLKTVTNSAGVDLTVKILATDLDNGTNLVGSATSLNDTLEITAGAGAGAADLDDVDYFDTIIIKDSTTAGSDAALTLNENLTTAMQTKLTIDASELDGSASADETLTVVETTSTVPLDVTGGGGADIISGGAGNDTIAGGAGGDAIDGQGGLDNIDAGAGNDTITLGSLADYSTAYGTDIIDGGAGVDGVVFTGAQNLTAANLSTITNTESWTIPTGSDLTLSDAVMANNPGLTFAFAGAGTLSSGEDSLGKSLMTTALNIEATSSGNLKLITSSSDDSFTFDQTESLTADDTIDGNAGTDTINIWNDDERAASGSADYGTGDAVTVAFGANVTNVEKLVILDSATDDTAGDVEITINSGYTGTALEIDGSALDANVTSSEGEALTVDNNAGATYGLSLTVTGGSFSDIISSGAGADIVSGGAGVDTLNGEGGNDIISGGAGNDIITGGTGLDSIDGGDGNDTIEVDNKGEFQVSGGVETVNGGAGTDVLDFTNTEAINLTAPELSKLFSIESITLSHTAASTLTFGNETFTSLGNPSLTITTSDGNATTSIDGSAVTNGAFIMVDDGTNANSDTMLGGSGDDTFRFTGTDGLDDGDSINGYGGTDTIDVRNSAAVSVEIDFADVKNIENITLSKSPLAATTSGNVLIEIEPAAGTANAGAVTVDLSAKSDATNNHFNTGANTRDTVDIDFTIIGSLQADSIIGSMGEDTITGGGTTIGDVLSGGSGNDHITGGGAADTIDGGAHNDTLMGMAGNDGITGGAGNDIIDGGAGTDTLDGEGGADVLTGGAGNDVFKYNAVADSSGNAKDTITDFEQSTLNATTGAQITNGDSISLIIATAVSNGGETSFILSDKGDVANAGEAVNAMNNSKGSFVFAKDNDVLYIDIDGDSTLNTDDYAFTLTGLDSFHGADIDVTFAGEDTDATTVTTLDGNDIITTGAGADTINSGAGIDTIAAAAGNNTINSGAGADIIGVVGAGADIIDAGSGNDTVTLGSGAGDDIVTLGTGDDSLVATAVLASTQKVVVTDFEDAGATVGDTVTLAQSLTTKDATGTPTIETIAVTEITSNGDYELATALTLATNAVDIVVLTDLDGTHNLTTDFTNESGAQLYLALATSGAVTTINVDNSGDEFYILAYSGGEAFLYHADSDANAEIAATEIKPLIHFDSQVGTFVAEDFILA